MNQFGLLRERRFGPLFFTQFFGAFNDNVLKNAKRITIAFLRTLSLNAIVILFAFAAATEAEADTLVNATAGIFILPFFLFSAAAGQVADKLEKSRSVGFVKVFGVGIMFVAGAGFWLKSTPILLGSLFLMGVHSTVFGP